MKNKFSFFCQKEFSIFAFSVSILLLTWPFIKIFDRGNPRVIFFYLFLLWAMIILLLFFVGIGYSRKFNPNKEKDTKN